MPHLVVIVIAWSVAAIGITAAAAEPTGRTVVVTSSKDSGPGTLRNALEHQRPLETITFDQGMFPPDRRVRIAVERPLPGLGVGNVTVDGSDAWVMLDGRGIAEDFTVGLQMKSLTGVWWSLSPSGPK